MNNSLFIYYRDLKQIDSQKYISQEYPECLNVEADFTVKVNEQEFIFENLPVLELYTKLNPWLNQDMLEEFQYTSLENTKPIFKLTSEDGEQWFLESSFLEDEIKAEIDLDDMILELWKFTVQLEVDIKKQFDIDFV